MSGEDTVREVATYLREFAVCDESHAVSLNSLAGDLEAVCAEMKDTTPLMEALLEWGEVHAKENKGWRVGGRVDYRGRIVKALATKRLFGAYLIFRSRRAARCEPASGKAAKQAQRKAATP